jgi:hypothetical protein
MKRAITVALFTLLSGCSLNSVAQGRKFPTPPQPAERSIPTHTTTETKQHKQIDFVELQRESRELSDLAHTIPLDMENISRGLLPKDVVDKLKRIEKLSKHLRSEVSP